MAPDTQPDSSIAQHIKDLRQWRVHENVSEILFGYRYGDHRRYALNVAEPNSWGFNGHKAPQPAHLGIEFIFGARTYRLERFMFDPVYLPDNEQWGYAGEECRIRVDGRLMFRSRSNNENREPKVLIFESWLDRAALEAVDAVGQFLRHETLVREARTHRSVRQTRSGRRKEPDLKPQKSFGPPPGSK